MKINRLLYFSGILLLPILLFPLVAQAFTIGFGEFRNQAQGFAVQDQLFVDVNESGNTAIFTFRNAGPVSSAVSEIYFDDGNLLGKNWTITNNTLGVEFVHGANPKNLPGGEDLDPDFESSKVFLYQATSPSPQYGINPGESLTLGLEIQKDKSIADVINGLLSGELRIGLHVQSIGAKGDSASLVNNRPVPEPTTMLISALMLVGAGGIIRRKFLKV